MSSAYGVPSGPFVNSCSSASKAPSALAKGVYAHCLQVEEGFWGPKTVDEITMGYTRGSCPPRVKVLLLVDALASLVVLVSI